MRDAPVGLRDSRDSVGLSSVDFTPATGGDEHTNEGADNCTRCRKSRRNCARWYYLQLAGLGTGGDANPKPHTRPGRQADQRVSLTMAGFLY